MRKTRNENDPVVIKKYANRRLYDTAKSAYVTLDDLAAMVRAGTDFVVRDAKTGEDLTRTILTQIIFEQEGRDGHLLPVDFLRQLIGFYGDSMQGMVPGFLDMSMKTLADNRHRMRKQMSQAMGRESLNLIEEQMHKNFALFQKTMQMFSPFTMGTGADTAKEKADAPAKDDDLSALRAQMAAMQEQLDKLDKKG